MGLGITFSQSAFDKGMRTGAASFEREEKKLKEIKEMKQKNFIEGNAKAEGYQKEYNKLQFDYMKYHNAGNYKLANEVMNQQQQIVNQSNTSASQYNEATNEDISAVVPKDNKQELVEVKNGYFTTQDVADDISQFKEDAFRETSEGKLNVYGSNKESGDVDFKSGPIYTLSKTAAARAVKSMVPSERESYIKEFNSLDNKKKMEHGNINNYIASRKNELKNKFEDPKKVEQNEKEVIKKDKEIKISKAKKRSLHTKLKKAEILHDKAKTKQIQSEIDIEDAKIEANDGVPKNASTDYANWNNDERLEWITDGGIDFDSANDKKKAGILFSEIGEAKLTEKIDQWFKEDPSKAAGKLEVLMKTGKDGVVTTNAYHNYLSGNIAVAIDDPDIVGGTGKLQEFINKTMDTYSGMPLNKSLKEKYIKHMLEPLKAAVDGKSGEFYQEDWNIASKKFDRKAGFWAGNIGSSEFGSLEDMIYSYQEVFNDKDFGLRDAFDTKEENMDLFFNDTFPRIQLAYKQTFPNKPLLTPKSFVEQMKNDYTMSPWDKDIGAEEGDLKEKSTLYYLTELAQQIQL